MNRPTGGETAIPASKTPAAALLLSLALTSAAVIAFQLVLMQLLSLSQWRHFAAMVISMALLGFGAAGTALALAGESLKRGFNTALPGLYLGCGATMAAATGLSGIFGDFDAFLLFFDGRQVALLLFSYLVCCLPFFFGGLAITLVFSREVARIGPLYGANMAGSGLGAVLMLGLFWLLPAPRLPGLLALLPLGSAWLTRPAAPVRRLFPALWGIALAAAAWSLIAPSDPQPSQYKALHSALQLPGADLLHRASSPFGRIDVVRAEALRFAPSLSLRYGETPPAAPVLFNNGDYLGTLLGRGAEAANHILDVTTRGLPYAVRRPDSVLVLEAATGTDVSQALAHGAARIIAVEPHRQANRLLREHHPEWIDSLYLDPRVALRSESTRSYLGRRGQKTFDLIVLPVLGEFGGGAGTHALQEQYHLTLEAFRAMWRHLGENGMMAATVWQDQPPRLALKLAATWRTLLDGEGIVHRSRHLAAVRSWGTMTFLLSRKPFTPDERERLRSFCRKLDFDPLLLEDLQPGERSRYNRGHGGTFFADLDRLLGDDPHSLLRRHPFDIRPARDDRPFFFHFLKWERIDELRRSFGDRELPYLELGFFLGIVTFAQILPAALILILLPLTRIGWRGPRRRWTFLYFAGLGIGYISFEIVLIQKLVLFLGEPIHAAAAVLAVLLICSGAGSYYSSARCSATAPRLAATGVFIAALLILYKLGLMPVLNLAMAWPPAAKIAAVFLVLAPPAFFMGMMFPLGLRRLATAGAGHIPWACGIDSCLSVTAAALATLIALEAGFGAVMTMAAAAYAVAALAAPQLGPPTAEPPAGVDSGDCPPP